MKTTEFMWIFFEFMWNFIGKSENSDYPRSLPGSTPSFVDRIWFLDQQHAYKSQKQMNIINLSPFQQNLSTVDPHFEPNLRFELSYIEIAKTDTNLIFFVKHQKNILVYWKIAQPPLRVSERAAKIRGFFFCSHARYPVLTFMESER